MNETSATSASSASGLSLLPEGIATLTAIHFAIIAVLAALVILGLVWGIRAKRSRVQASRDVIEHAEEAGVPPEPAPLPTPAAPVRAAPTETPIEARSQTQSQTGASVTPSPVAPSPVAPSPVAVPPVAAAPAAPAPTAPAIPDNAAADAPAAAPASDRVADEAARVAAPAPVPPIASSDGADGPITQLKGLGPKVAARLAELGITTVGEMAALSDSAAQTIDTQLGTFTGRMHRDRWIEQARLLAAGDKAGFEAKFGKL